MDNVAKQKGFTVNWRLISLSLLNMSKNYEEDFPPNYELLHGKGLAMLRVAAAARRQLGPDALAELYKAYGESIWNRSFPEGSRPADAMAEIATPEHFAAVLTTAGLPGELAEAALDDSFDDELLAETKLALSRTGSDVGTPIITYQPPDGVSFFGPVISDLPPDDEAVKLWDMVLELASWSGFAELKRSRREQLNLPLMQGLKF